MEVLDVSKRLGQPDQVGHWLATTGCKKIEPTHRRRSPRSHCYVPQEKETVIRRLVHLLARRNSDTERIGKCQGYATIGCLTLSIKRRV